ncbi:MAG: aspartate/glutamate racemase family protein [Devosiaceae bacterium]|nr:aspartate/glutamate racemase family protein [Devosiaceae bacterium MH13]
MPPMLGILSLDTAFPRIAGDVGNPASYPFAAEVAIVDGAHSTRIVVDGMPSETITARMEAAARDLEARGARAIISTCGFLVTVQARIAGSVGVPVLLSALSLVPELARANGGRVGVLTASRKALGTLALEAAGIAPNSLVIEGLEDEPLFAQTFLAPYDDQPTSFDRRAMEAVVVAAAQRLQARAPDVTALVLECGNLPPYSDAIAAATGLPVHHLADAAGVLMASTEPVPAEG